ncbi:DUF5052 domain-containing protein [Priestia megaterium]|uniref:DUF5052 domain-containing protein n=1 Tax=Priestia megaterium TaxID=1404 RepID=UPI002E23EE43|nr:DUF5052 domain-containing protein [Priestia megaterium]
MKKKLLIGATLSMVLLSMAGCESSKRFWKGVDSEFGGLNRTVEVVGINGEVMRKYEGKFDVDADASKVKFVDEKGKSHIIYRSQTDIIIVDEK